MNQYLIEFQLPLFFKSAFGSLPMAVYVVLLLGGLVLMFLPEPRRTGLGGEGNKDVAMAGGPPNPEHEKRTRRLLLGLFLVGFALFTLGLIGIGVRALNNDAVETAAYDELLVVLNEAEGGLETVLHDPRGAVDLRNALHSRVILAHVDPLAPEYWGETVAVKRATALRDALNQLPAVINQSSFLRGGEPQPTTGPEAEAAAGRVWEAWEAARAVPVSSEFPLQEVKIPSYGVMIMLGFLGAIAIAYMRARVYRTDPNVIIDMGIIAMVGGIVGARLFHVFEYWSDLYAIDPVAKTSRTFGEALWEALQIQNGGLVFYGGLIVAALAIFVYLRIRRLPILFYMDIGAIVVPIGHAFGRIGCFFNGCCWGDRCDPNFFLATFYNTSKTFEDISFPAYTPLYASQMIESITGFALFLLLTLYYQFVARKRGETLAMLFILYGINRFFTQMLRADVPKYGEGDILLTSSQWLSVAVVAVGVAVWYWLRYRRPQELPPRRIGVELERRGIKRLTTDGKIPPVALPPATRS